MLDEDKKFKVLVDYDEDELDLTFTFCREDLIEFVKAVLYGAQTTLEELGEDDVWDITKSAEGAIDVIVEESQFSGELVRPDKDKLH